MPIITLTTDLGIRGFYVPAVKGKILQLSPTANIIDLSHHVDHFNILEAAFIVKNSFSDFPTDTVHIIDINSLLRSQIRYLAIKYKGYYFISADNGIFSMIFDGTPEKIVEINYRPQTSFPLKDIFAVTACHLANGNPIEAIGKTLNEFTSTPMMQPAIYESSIRAMVIYIDSYENVFLNVTKELFDGVGKGRNAVISFRRVEIGNISNNYYDVIESELVCFFNSIGFLEIAINRGKASTMFGLKMSDIVQIDFR